MKYYKIQNWLTKNGARVLFAERHEIPMITLSIDFSAGSSSDKNKYGIAHLTNLLLSQGSNKIGINKLATLFSECGAYFKVNCDRDMATLELKSLSQEKYFDPALNLLSEILTTADFPNNNLVREKEIILSTIKQQEQMPDIIAKNRFYSNLYTTHPYAHPVLGTFRSISNLKQKDIKEFFANHYQVNKSTIVIVGDTTRKKAEKIANKIDMSLNQENYLSIIPIANRDGIQSNDYISFPSEQTHIILGQIGISYSDINYFPLLLGNQILGGATLTSRLFNEIRIKRGLAYSVFSFISPLKANGPFGIAMQTRHPDNAIKLALIEIERFISSGPTKEELLAIKNKMIHGFPLTIAQNNSIHIQLRKIGFYHLPNDYLESYRQNIKNVTLNQVKHSFQEYFNKNKLNITIVGKI
jgi:zinc protease